MMSSATDETDEVCASCGVAAIDDVKLKDCNGGCDLVKYCSDGCRELHQPEHAGECKKRLAEIRDRDLFEQPDESHLGECPICCLPMPLDADKSTLMPCCCKIICNGCAYANQKREIAAGLEQRCAFCREPAPKTEGKVRKNLMKRVKANDPAAIAQFGKMCSDEGNHETALKYWTKAAELGDTNALGGALAHFDLSVLYRYGQGVEKDDEKGMYHLEQAAMKGHPNARHNLGCEEANNRRYERAKKHFIINANLGDDGSLKCLRQLYAEGHASKEDYAGALLAYQAAVNTTKSPERAAAEVFEKNY